jgi:GT2 family glycosyltransferase
VLAHTTDDTDCIVTLNDDVEVPGNYLSTLTDAASRYPGSIIASVEYDINTRHISSVGSRLSWLTARGKPVDPLKDCDPNDKTIVSITEASGRGTLIPLGIFQKIGLYDQRHLPHYGSDYDFSYRASRAGYRVIVCLTAHVFSHTEKTGITTIRQNFSFRDFCQYLTNIKSPANLKARWWLAVNNCPRLLLPTFLILDVFFVTGSYFKFHLLNLLKKNI